MNIDYKRQTNYELPKDCFDLNEHFGDNLDKWYNEIISDPHPYKVFITERSYNLALLLEKKTDKKMEDKHTKYLTRTALEFYLPEIADMLANDIDVRKYFSIGVEYFEKFPIVFCLDLNDNANEINHFLYDLLIKLTSLIEKKLEVKKEKQINKIKKKLSPHILYPMDSDGIRKFNDEVQRVWSDFSNRMKYELGQTIKHSIIVYCYRPRIIHTLRDHYSITRTDNMEGINSIFHLNDPNCWNELLFCIENNIRINKMPTPAYLLNEEIVINPQFLNENEDFTYTKYLDKKYTYQENIVDANNKLKAITSVRLSCIDKERNLYKASPFVFIPNLSANELKKLKSKLISYMQKAQVDNDVIEWMNEMDSMEDKSPFVEFISLIINNIVLQDFNERYNIEINKEDLESELLRLSRNYNQYGQDKTIELLRGLLTTKFCTKDELKQCLTTSYNASLNLKLCSEDIDQASNILNFFYNRRIESIKRILSKKKSHNLSQIVTETDSINVADVLSTKIPYDNKYTIPCLLQFVDSGLIKLTSFSDYNKKNDGFQQNIWTNDIVRFMPILQMFSTYDIFACREMRNHFIKNFQWNNVSLESFYLCDNDENKIFVNECFASFVSFFIDNCNIIPIQEKEALKSYMNDLVECNLPVDNLAVDTGRRSIFSRIEGWVTPSLLSTSEYLQNRFEKTSVVGKEIREFQIITRFNEITKNITIDKNIKMESQPKEKVKKLTKVIEDRKY